MNIVVHDYSGHPCQMHLSRGLARRGHSVVHQYCPSYTTGRGGVERREDDTNLSIQPVLMPGSFARYSVVVRIRQELAYGRQAAEAVIALRPDVALLSNVPLLALAEMVVLLRRHRVPYVFWLQDVYSTAIRSVLRRRLGRMAELPGGIAARLERMVARSSRKVVPISEDFRETLLRWGVPDTAIHVVENWAPIEELPQQPRNNEWATRHGLSSRPTVMYAGTLGYKHDPGLLVQIAKHLEQSADVVVVSQGRGRQFLEQARAEHDLRNLTLLDYQPYDQLPHVLGSADILLAILECDVSLCSVPSKILSYLCAGRPVVAALDPDNPVARMITEADAGVIVSPGCADEMLAALQRLLQQPEERTRLGVNARQFAEHHFQLEPIAAKFEVILQQAVRLEAEGDDSYPVEDPQPASPIVRR